MYDRRLDALIAAAETGSFAAAARRLHISTPALAKQVNTFEREYRITVFDRSRSGVTPTAAGAEFIEDARSIVRQSNEIIARMRRRAHTGTPPVRLGISALRPARRVLDLWQREADPRIRVELVSMPDDDVPIDDIIAHLGEDIDAVATAFAPEHWNGTCGTLPISYEPLCMAVPRDHPLSRRPRLKLDDLAGRDGVRTRIRILRRCGGTDDIARDLLERLDGVELVDIDHYDLNLFNECAETGDLLISKPMWDGVHPQLVNVPVDWPRPVGMHYGLLYPADPEPQVRAFVERIGALAGVASEP
ncbi:LysR family transcriptional regulator [Bifidobacterium callitrichos]|uniref:LysR family transcriptional regulator n=1 Tax=Bifidobacterium callitrichos DSM 23973 TaxID=1437609 RepID=A0A086ZW05_9BIFI|nr:LysR family transcriptional regulator [Bifidobacterium callitrichos]KFI50705.1 LysR family transcriptional regulator [Bifidobacterium callitrichos DSM 23973]